MAFNSSMPMFWGDYLRDTGHLSPAEHGAYLMLIAHQWTTAKPLPDDDDKLARIARMSTREWKSAKAVVMEFFDIEDGAWSQGRVASELVKARDLYELRSMGGLRSAERRRKSKETNQQSSNTVETVNQAVHQVPKPEPKPVDDVDDSARGIVARETSSHVAVGETVLDIMGVRENPNYAFHYAIVGGWLSAGYDPEADIYPTVRAVMAKRNGQGPPGSLSYFTAAIGQAHRDRTTPVSPDLGPIHAKQSSPNQRRGSIAAADSLIAKMADKGLL